ncbi:MAG: hypothetical protein ACYTDY_05805 [Planctomycetota bacterium]|jgi:hypothetical protein
MSLLALLLALAAAAPPTVVHETARYRIEAEAAPAEAREMGLVLEAAWAEWAAYFGKEPRLEKDEKLRVVFCATKASFDARLRRDGVKPPKAGGYYSPGRRTAYLWRQPTGPFTRMLLLHECTHQFHYLARTGNRGLPAKWYVEGLAEYLSRHHWDGEKVTLGVVPVVTLEDYPAAARKALQTNEVDLRDVVEGKKFHRPVSFALLRYLSSADGGKHRKRFDKVAAKLDRGVKSSALLFKTFGSPAALRERLLAFLEEEQEPFSQIFNSWEGTGPRGLHGFAPGAIVSACRVKGPAKRLEARLEIPAEGRWIGGMLLHHEGKDDYTVALIHNGKRIRVDRRRNGKWEILVSVPCPKPSKPGSYALEAVRSKDGVRMRVEGVDVGPFALPGSALGLALMGSDLKFSDLSWE